VTLTSFLGKPEPYVRQIRRLYKKYSQNGRIFQVHQDEVNLISIAFNEMEIARALAKHIRKENYFFEPAKINIIYCDNKAREILSFRLTDTLVQGAMAEYLTRKLSPVYSKHVKSYQKGNSWVSTLSSFARFVRNYRKKIKDPRKRGLYVFRGGCKKLYRFHSYP